MSQREERLENSYRTRGLAIAAIAGLLSVLGFSGGSAPTHGGWRPSPKTAKQKAARATQARRKLAQRLARRRAT